jgi:hypothetical protein
MGLLALAGWGSARAQAPIFSAQPSNATVTAGGNATFGPVAASGAPTFAWQVSTNGGVIFSNITNSAAFSGNNTATLTALATNSTENGWLVRALAINGTGTTASTSATLTVNFAPTFSTQPTNSTVAVGANATFTVATTGNPAPTLQWQISTNGGALFTNITNGAGFSGNTGTILTVIAVNSTQSTNVFRAVATNSVAPAGVNSTNATLLVPPTFTTQPGNATVIQGSGNATFSVVLSGNPAPTLQWQVSANGGALFTNITNGAGFSGNTSSTLTVIAPLVGQSGNLFRAVGTDTGGTTNSTNATLTVNVTPSFTTQPGNVTLGAGGNATFTGVAGGTPAPTLQWQVSLDGGNTWSNITNGAGFSGNNSTTLTVIGVTAAQSGNLFQLLAINTVTTVTSSTGSLTVNAGPAITLQPTSRTRTVGQSTTLSGAASGSPAPVLQWQVSLDNGVTFSNTTDGAVFNGSTTPSLTVTNITQAMSGNEFRLTAANFISTANSTAAILTVNTPVSITVQPANTTVTAGGSGLFAVTATGTPTPTYQWQVSSDSGFSYGNLSDGGGIAGSATANLTVSNTTAAMNQFQYRALVINAAGTVASSAAVLTVNFAPVITTQPVGLTVVPGVSANFTVAASGNPAPTYQWQVSTNGGGNYSNVINGGGFSGSTNATLMISSTTGAMSGDLFQCVATNSVNTATSAAALLTVNTPVGIATQPPAMQLVNGLSNVVLNVTASGTGPFSYQWNYFNGTAWNPVLNGQGPALTLLGVSSAMTSGNAGNYEVVIKNSVGSITSSVTTLNVAMIPTIASQTAISPNPVARGAGVQMSVVAYGVQPLKYQWTKNGRRLVNNGRISGATSPTLSIARVVLGDAGKYSVTITNTQPGGKVTSLAVPLAVK